MRRLRDLAGIGPAALKDLELLNVPSVEALAASNPDQLYAELERLTARRQDPCVLDVLRCAVAQARNPDLPTEQRNWWYWSRLRKAGQC